MKRKFVLPALITSIFATTVGAVASSLAWFSDKTSINPDSHFNGASNGAYFGGGNGSSTEPFLIKNPRHLYNLAWLQYMGYFNRDEKDTSGNPVIEDGVVVGDGIIDKQYYFQLDNDIDMSGWKIPPIGTSLYPFVGNFDGNNKTISNLTTTNRYQDYNKVPTTVKTAGSVSDVEIVGLFGVVGTTGNTEGSITSGSKTYTYTTSTVAITNFGLDNFTAKTIASNTLVGLIAGYVNGPISGVAVKGSKINTNGNSAITSYTSNISDYSLVGYIKPTYRTNMLDSMLRKDVQAETPTVENETQSGSGDEFGASIAMQTMYDRLLSIKTSASNFTYVTSETYYDGVINDAETEYTTYTNGNYEFVGNSETDDQGHQVSQFSFYDRGSSYDAYMYLYGDTSKNYTKTTVNVNSLTAVPSSGSTIYIAVGDNFLRYNSGITNSTRANATLWTFSNGRISNGNRYLRNNGGTFTTTTNTQQATTWTITKQSNNNFAITSTANNNTYVLTYYDDEWTLLNTSTLPATYKFHNGTNYLRWGGTGDTIIYNETNSANATEWLVNNNGYYYPSGHGGYYIGYGNNRLQAATGNTTNFTIETYNNNEYLHGSNTGWFSTTHYYAKYGTPTWTYSSNRTQGTARNNATTITRDTITKSISDYATNLYVQSSTNTPLTFTTNPTYFPLSYEENVDANGNGLGTYNNNIAEKNTGYVVSGTNYTTQPSDMRVSRYAISNLSTAFDGNSYNSAKTNIVTIDYKTGNYALVEDSYNKNNQTINSDLTDSFGDTRTSVADLGLVKYTASRKQLHTLLNGSSYAYGLHFMDAAISASNKITVPYAYINGTEYTNYELPRDSIDFNLKNNGYINFFAGSYFPDNDTFFSLHNIIRNESTNAITAIKEISKIYLNKGEDRKTYRYTYQYSDGSYNTNIGTHNASDLLFDMTWVTNPTMVDNALYYYEIPANKGEYALGSVSGKDGAYLIYLDIGAGVKTKNVTTYTEKITTTTETYKFVKGVEFVATIPSDLSTISGGEVANITVPASVSGNTTFSYNATNKVLTCGPPTGGTLTSTYISNDVTVTVTGVGDLTATYESTSTTILDKITTITYDNDAETLVKVVTTQETIDGVVQDEEVSDPIVLEEDLQEYEAPAVIDGIEQIVLHFHYQILGSGTLTIESSYDSSTDTYSFTITADTTVILYIDDVLESYTTGGITVDYTVNINDSPVADNDVITITAS